MDDASTDIEELDSIIAGLRKDLDDAWDLICALDPVTMHSHMDGHHQVRCRGNGSNLTPKQWLTVRNAKEYG